MQPFTTLTGIAAPIDEPNIDTNQLCPTRFNKVPRGPKYRDVLFHDRRFNADGTEKEHLLNVEPFKRAQIIAADKLNPRQPSQTVLVAGDVDVNKALDRILKEQSEQAKEIERLEGKLRNQEFTAKAPPDVITDHQDRLTSLRRDQTMLASSEQQLRARLGA